MTQEELADKLGYKSRSSINKMENERIIPIKKAHEFAAALGTTPEYLLGYSDISDKEFYKDSSEILELYSKMNDESREKAKKQLRMILFSQEKNVK